eukprot:gene10779-biopygen4071
MLAKTSGIRVGTYGSQVCEWRKPVAPKY